MQFSYAQKPHLTIKPLIESKYYILVKKNSRYNKIDFFQNDDLSTLPIIAFKQAQANLIPGTPHHMNVVSEVNDLTLLVNLVENDIGIGLITLQEYYMLNLSFDKYALKPILSDSTVYYALVYHEDILNNEHLKQLVLTEFFNYVF